MLPPGQAREFSKGIVVLKPGDVTYFRYYTGSVNWPYTKNSV